MRIILAALLIAATPALADMREHGSHRGTPPLREDAVEHYAPTLGDVADPRWGPGYAYGAGDQLWHPGGPAAAHAGPEAGTGHGR